ncbi:hypothetical protein IEQ34_005550 [Dendrobium chrysotoxum]|uniref:Uncharacterized protein n=1 Tax=Dendrobium chrysotoxum TaxID=161865 RepID=A0AAV7H904_DENCH|nr:hypothetical protein IEQ34_005550 [Dendrobium chrysotoxum]
MRRELSETKKGFVQMLVGGEVADWEKRTSGEGREERSGLTNTCEFCERSLLDSFRDSTLLATRSHLFSLFLLIVITAITS